MSQAQKGNTVKVHYTGKFEDGNVFDSSADREPLEFTIGSKMVIPGFEDAIIDKKVGEKVSTEIEAKDAYGEYMDELKFEVEKKLLPEGYEAKVGGALQIPGQNGQPIPVTIVEVGDDKITLDANHPLAGKKLFFDLEIISIA